MQEETEYINVYGARVHNLKKRMLEDVEEFSEDDTED